MKSGKFQYLITGGFRSGKSAYAELKALDISHDPVFISTSEFLDDEVEAHLQAQAEARGERWGFVHAPINLVGALKNSDKGTARLIDNLRIWVANLLYHERDWQVELKALIHALETQRSPVILLSEEMGLGMEPEDEGAKQFCKILGEVNRNVAAQVGTVEFIVAGLPLKVK